MQPLKAKKVTVLSSVPQWSNSCLSVDSSLQIS